MSSVSCGTVALGRRCERRLGQVEQGDGDGGGGHISKTKIP